MKERDYDSSDYKQFRCDKHYLAVNLLLPYYLRRLQSNWHETLCKQVVFFIYFTFLKATTIQVYLFSLTITKTFLCSWNIFWITNNHGDPIRYQGRIKCSPVSLLSMFIYCHCLSTNVSVFRSLFLVSLLFCRLSFWVVKLNRNQDRSTDDKYVFWMA